MENCAIHYGTIYPDVYFVKTKIADCIEIIYDKVEYNQRYKQFRYFHHNYLVAIRSIK